MASISPTEAQITAAVSKFREAWRVSTWKSISASQSGRMNDPGAKGPMWVSRETFPAPGENGLLDVIVDAIASLGDGHEEYTISPATHVQAEWTGYRLGVSVKAVEPLISENEIFQALVAETASPLTILYVFGGAY